MVFPGHNSNQDKILHYTVIRLTFYFIPHSALLLCYLDTGGAVLHK